MNIGLNGRFYGARVTGVQRFARELSARVFERLPATLFLPAGVPAPEALPEQVRVVRGRLSGHTWEQLELPRTAREHRCDVLLHLSGTAPRWGGPHLVVVYDLIPLTSPEWYTRPFRLWFRFALGHSARRAAGVVAISEWTRTELERLLDIPRERIRVVSQGLEPFDHPASPEAVRRVRERWSLPERYLLGLGGRNPRKNTAFLVTLLERWRERHGEAPALVLVGEEYSHVHARVALGGDPPSGVHFLGHVTDAELHALYTDARAFCFPSLAEGFGRPPLEAMACGTPAVVASYGAAAEVVSDAAPILPLVPDLWIDALRPLVSGGTEREERVRRGREHAARFNWDQAAEEFLAACRATADLEE